ncbi:MAG TPA: FG-GAP-like repeat-containing protein [Candidatus Aquilonibacter sp.]|nr:FG-GAP-like repeat-containing protein [Candidatus Aquilonibacter sp.]
MLRQTLSRLALLLLMAPLALTQTGQFVEAPQFATGTNPQAVASADLNGDGHRDLVVVNFTSNTISVMLGNGDGTFSAKVDYPTGSAPQGIAVGDFNGDGKLDLAVTNSASNTVSIFLGNGDGTFQLKKDFATGRGPLGVAVGDFNKDGNADLVVTNTIDGTVSIFLGNGDGTFAAHVDHNTGFNPASVVVVDLDKDGNPDVAVACDVNTTSPQGVSSGVISVLRGNGDGTFQTQLQFFPEPNPVSIVAADFNGDGSPDLAVAETGGVVSVLLSNGKSGISWNFLAPVAYGAGAFPTGIAAGDFNNDGKMDLAVSNGNGNSISVLLGNGDGTFQSQASVGTGNIPYSVIVDDFNGDQKMDLVAANSGGNTVSVILGNGDGTFQTRSDYPAGPSPYAVAAGDFNRDGILDLVVTNSNCPNFPTCNDGTVSILLGNGDGSFQQPVEYTTGTKTDPFSVAVGDFNGDKILDLAVANYATGTVSIFLGNGDGTFEGHVDYRVMSQPASLAVGDFNHDGKLDIVAANFNSNTVSVLLGNGDGTFKSPATYNVGKGPISVAVADVNNDGKPDLVVLNETDLDVGILLGNGDGTFQPQVTYTTGVGGNPLDVVVGDFNGDNNLDLAIADFQKQRVSVLLGNGDGSFQPVVHYPTLANPSSIVMADFNGDGALDLAVTSTPPGNGPGNLVSLLLGNGDGSFGQPILFSAGDYAYSSVVGDFNGDSAPDLAVANGASSTVSILVNAQGTKMTLHTSGSPSISGDDVTFTATVGASVPQAGSPTGTVTIMSGGTVLGSGSLSGGRFDVSTTALAVGADKVTAVYAGNGHFQEHTVSMTQQVTSFQISTSALSPSTVSAGGSATATVMITPVNGFDPSSVTLTCSVSPTPSKPATCSIGGISVAGGMGTATLTVSTVGTSASLTHPAGMGRQPQGWLALGLVLPALFLASAGIGKQNGRKMLGLCLVLLLVSGMVFQMACSNGGSNNNGGGGGGGGGGSTGTPSGQYAITVTGNAGTSLQVSAPMLTLTVQ